MTEVDLVGLGAEGWEGLRPAARAALERADMVVAAPRHHDLLPGLKGERRAWPTPFAPALEGLSGRVAIVVTGDPLWHSAGEAVLRRFPGARVHPQLSSVQWAAARMGWSLREATLGSVHGRPVAAIRPLLRPGARLLLLSEAGAPAAVAALLVEAGYGFSRMTALSDLGAAAEARVAARAEAWSAEVPPLHVLAIECEGPAPWAGALPDEAFDHDGQLTKAEVRAATLARLRPEGRLWDIGAGSGAIGIEWLRQGGAEVCAVEPNPERLARAEANAARQGVALTPVAGRAPEALEGLPAPDAVFVGGGLAGPVLRLAAAALPRGGRLVANAVTLDSEALLIDAQARLGGSLARISVSRAEPVGTRLAWRPLAPITQWAWIK